MPTYQFRCVKCEHTHDIVASMAASWSPPMCQFCTVDMKRVFSAAPVHFKGDGWASKTQ
jgi:putative FmdB family regulatory protein